MIQFIPDGEWFCPECRPKNIQKQPRKMRKSFIEQENDIFSGDDDERKPVYLDNDAETINRLL